MSSTPYKTFSQRQIKTNKPKPALTSLWENNILHNALIVFGTRPEAIKMAPIIKQMKLKMHVTVCVTAQHRELLDEVLEVFSIVPDIDLNLMQKNQSLSTLTSDIIVQITDVIKKIKPDIILVHGDTTTSMATALAAFYLNITVAHVEAGLRSHNKTEPFPEEINRKIISNIADLHFAPTNTSAQNLINEGIPEKTVHITGNTVIDALLIAVNLPALPTEKLKQFAPENMKILLTAHRRESLEFGLSSIFNAILILAKKYPEIEFIYPVHPNPNVRQTAYEMLAETKNVQLIDPLDYKSFLQLMQDCYLILTDSGGIQEEAPTLNTPVIVLRNVTERVEALEANCIRLVGLETANIVSVVSELIDDKQQYELMCQANNPYGNGEASAKITSIIATHLRGYHG